MIYHSKIICFEYVNKNAILVSTAIFTVKHCLEAGLGARMELYSMIGFEENDQI